MCIMQIYASAIFVYANFMGCTLKYSSIVYVFANRTTILIKMHHIFKLCSKELSCVLMTVY